LSLQTVGMPIWRGARADGRSVHSASKQVRRLHHLLTAERSLACRTSVESLTGAILRPRDKVPVRSVDDADAAAHETRQLEDRDASVEGG